MEFALGFALGTLFGIVAMILVSRASPDPSPRIEEDDDSTMPERLRVRKRLGVR